MKENIEIELKVLVSKEQFENLLSFYQPAKFEKQVNYYYKTNNMEHYGFRIRVKKDEQLFTLKDKVNGYIKEYEKTFTGAFYQDLEIKKVLNEFSIYPPYECFNQLTTNRYLVNTGLAELCFDINTYNDITDYEIEYEVKKNHDYLTTFQQILAKANIEYIENNKSKYRRCFETTK